MIRPENRKLDGANFNLHASSDTSSVFSSLFARRPEISADRLEHDLATYYEPYAAKLINLRNRRQTTDGVVVGVSAIQGAGKTTQGEIMEVLLGQKGYSSVSLSIDDHYLTHEELTQVREADPRIIRRGVTHDVDLARRDLQALKSMRDGDVIVIAGYDKGPHSGDGDRFRWINPTPGLVLKAEVGFEELTVDKKRKQVPSLQLKSAQFEGKDVEIPEKLGSHIPIVEKLLPAELRDYLIANGGQELSITTTGNGEVQFTAGETTVSVAAKDLPKGGRLVTEKPDFIFYDGWMVGAKPVQDETVFDSGLPGLETNEDGEFARSVNRRLANYQQLWGEIDFLNVLHVQDYKMSLQWRDQAEEALRAKGQGMTPDEIREFVYYFWRSVHPAIQIEQLAQSNQTDQVAVIGADHSILNVRYPKDTTAAN